jgi:HAD superfamily hydrolase (TIGR01459 family)
MSSNILFKKNSAEIYQNYSHFIIDIWGVIHDGSHIYPNVIENLTKIRKSGKKICFLSNAPRRAVIVEKLLNNFGITDDLYDFILTSGEASFLYLKDNHSHGKNYFYMGESKDLGLLDSLHYKMTKIEDSDFIINTGFGEKFPTIESRKNDLELAIQYKLPMICVNPDLIVVKQSGLKILCAGILAQTYEEMGGKVIYFGKPHDFVYQKTKELFQISSSDKILAIGDGIETDILGANNNNIDSALIAGGILGDKMNVKYLELPDKNIATNICDSYKIYPKYILAGL